MWGTISEANAAADEERTGALELHITAQGITLSEDLEQFTRRKVERLSRYLPYIAVLNVELARQKTRHRSIASAQITLRHQRGAILRAEVKQEGNDRQAMQQAIIGAVDRMYRQISRFKGKRMDRKRRSRFQATVEELDLAETLPEEHQDVDESIEESTEALAIIRRKMIPVTIMSEREAVEQMELLGHAFYLFRDAESGALSVLYRRDEDGYGVLHASAGEGD